MWSSKHWVLRILLISTRVTREITYMQFQVRLCGETLVTYPLLEVSTGSSDAVWFHLKATEEFGGWFAIKKSVTMATKAGGTWAPLLSTLTYQVWKTLHVVFIVFILSYYSFLLLFLSVLPCLLLVVTVVAKKGFSCNQTSCHVFKSSDRAYCACA